MKKSFKIFITVVLSSLTPFCFYSEASESSEEGQTEELDMFDEDFDSMFEEASDTQAVINTTKETASATQASTFPLTLSGHLDTEFGAGYVYAYEQENKPNGYFTFNNYIYMNARPTRESTIHGTLGISFPGYTLGLNECYFDYIIKNKIYFTAGKKATTWGYTRLFTYASNSTKDYEVGGENTNILHDSGSGTTFMFRFPLWTGTITGMGIYTGKSTSPSFGDMRYAGSIEMVIAKVSVNLFCRKETSDAGATLGPIIGLEAKRTILGADVYGQGICRFDTDSKFKQIFKGTLNKATIQKLIFTGGFYKWWDAKDPAVGFNIEYQGTYSVSSSEETVTETDMVHRIAFDGGVKRLGKNHNIKVGMEMSHNISDNSGYLKPGVLISGALPNCDWNSGLKWEYGGSLPKSGKFTFGTYLELVLNY